MASKANKQKPKARVAKPRPAKAKRRVTAAHERDADLYSRVAEILEQARAQVARTVNTTMVNAYWLIGREIVEVEQAGASRATYGTELLERLSKQLRARFGEGFGVRTLEFIRRFYLAFPAGSKIPKSLLSESGSQAVAFSPALSWTHYIILSRVANEQARSFYEIEAARERWSVRQLERQIAALLYERLATNRTPDKVLALAREGQEIAKPSDVIKDPFVLEFLDLREHSGLHERDVEQAIIDRLETFLLELGKGFSFVGRQVRLTVEGDHFYVDLVFYNRLLRCFVLIDLKLGKLTHQDLGQMMMYVNYYDRTQRAPDEAKTVGIVLCSEKNDAMVRITLPEDNDQILAATYKRYLPTEAELAAELTREREEAERQLRLRAATDGDKNDES
jgi:predicted nuclease of restriction endonuclease-like (RecB) superfamily